MVQESNGGEGCSLQRNTWALMLNPFKLFQCQIYKEIHTWSSSHAVSMHGVKMDLKTICLTVYYNTVVVECQSRVYVCVPEITHVNLCRLKVPATKYLYNPGKISRKSRTKTLLTGCFSSCHSCTFGTSVILFSNITSFSQKDSSHSSMSL